MGLSDSVAITAPLAGFKAMSRSQLRSMTHEQHIEMLIDLKHTEKFEALNWRTEEDLSTLSAEDAYRRLHDIWDLAQKI